MIDQPRLRRAGRVAGEVTAYALGLAIGAAGSYAFALAGEPSAAWFWRIMGLLP